MGPLDDGRHSSPAKAQAELPASVRLDEAEVAERYREQLRRSLAPDEEAPTDAIVWFDAGAELLLYPTRARVDCDDGLVVVGIPVFTEQTDEAEVVVPFAVGPQGAPGLVMATETRARGPDAVVDRWGEPLIAVAWDALVGLAVEAVAPALPAGLSASPRHLTVTEQVVDPAGLESS
jgi:hypothetical protein